jgi:glycosyltransferase involved in cell wall biosynthesis
MSKYVSWHVVARKLQLARTANSPREASMSDSSAPLSVLVPVYNEEKTVIHVLRKVLALGTLLKEIVVVDDGSQDRTAQLVTELASFEPKIRLFRLLTNSGKTAAIRCALAEATGDIVIVQDADLEYDPREIPDVVAPILDGHADVVYGSRFLVRKSARVLYFYHYLANVGLTFLSNLLTNRNMTDIETCYKAFRAGVIKPLTLTSRGFGLEIEITALISKTCARTYEVPISYYGRTYEEGKKIGFWDGVLALWYIVLYNLLTPHTRRGKDYVASVDNFLRPIVFGGRGAEQISGLHARQA